MAHKEELSRKTGIISFLRHLIKNELGKVAAADARITLKAAQAGGQDAAAAHQSGCWSGAPKLSNVVDSLESCRLVIFKA